MKPTVEADSRRAGGRVGGTGLWLLPWPALNPASAPRRPRAPESAPRSCIRRKAVRVRCHRCHGTGIGIASAPYPHPSGLPPGGGEGSPYTSLRVQHPEPGVCSLGCGARRLRSGSGIPRYQMGAAVLSSACEKHAVANSTQSLHLAARGRFIPLRLSSLTLLVPNLGKPRNNRYDRGGQPWHP